MVAALASAQWQHVWGNRHLASFTSTAFRKGHEGSQTAASQLLVLSCPYTHDVTVGP